MKTSVNPTSSDNNIRRHSLRRYLKEVEIISRNDYKYTDIGWLELEAEATLLLIKFDKW